MPRKKLILSDTLPYHVVNRANKKLFFDAPKNELWKIFTECFWKLRTDFNINIYAFVLLDNHYHSLIGTPELNISSGMEYLHREVAKKSNKFTGFQNHVFGGRYRPSLVSNESYYWNVVKYIYRNPVEAGLCRNVEDYFFSSLNQNGPQYPWCLVDVFNKNECEIIPDLKWLNEKNNSEHNELISNGLKKSEFILRRNKNGNPGQLDKINFNALIRKKVPST